MFVSSWLSIANNIKLLKSYANECPYRVLIKNPVKEMLIGKGKKKKTINGLTVFFISYKSNIKIFFNWIIN